MVTHEFLSLLHERYSIGLETYGVPLMRDTLADPIQAAIEEMIDACIYLRAAIEQRSPHPSDREVVEMVMADVERMGTDAPSGSSIVQVYRRQLLATKELIESHRANTGVGA